MSWPRCMRRSTTARGAPMYVFNTPPTHNREPYDTRIVLSNIMFLYIDPYAERMPRADCSSNTIRDSISRK